LGTPLLCCLCRFDGARRLLASQHAPADCMMLRISFEQSSLPSASIIHRRLQTRSAANREAANHLHSKRSCFCSHKSCRSRSWRSIKPRSRACGGGHFLSPRLTYSVGGISTHVYEFIESQIGNQPRLRSIHRRNARSGNGHKRTLEGLRI
jgi:hypothetical protein